MYMIFARKCIFPDFFLPAVSYASASSEQTREESPADARVTRNDSACVKAPVAEN